MGYYTDTLITLSGLKNVVKEVCPEFYRPIDIHYQHGDCDDLVSLDRLETDLRHLHHPGRLADILGEKNWPGGKTNQPFQALRKTGLERYFHRQVEIRRNGQFTTPIIPPAEVNSHAGIYFAIRWCQASAISLNICGRLRVSFHLG